MKNNKNQSELKEYFEIDKRIKSIIEEVKPSSKTDENYVDSLLEKLYVSECCIYKMANISGVDKFNEEISILFKKFRLKVLKSGFDKNKISEIYENDILKKDKSLREEIEKQIKNNTHEYYKIFNNVKSMNDILTFYHFCALDKLTNYFINEVNKKGMKGYEYRKH